MAISSGSFPRMADGGASSGESVQRSNASFRGVSFFVESREEEVGRRVAIHEVPLRDGVFTEDLGRKARQFPVEAFVLGEDWQSRRDSLLEACEQEGPATLVLPRRGSLRAVCTGCRVREVMRERRIATFSLTFVEAGEAAYPSQSLDSRRSVRSASDRSILSAGGLLDRRFSLAGMPSFVSNNALADVLGLSRSAGMRSMVGNRTLWAELLSRLTGIGPAGFLGSSMSALLSFLYLDAGDDVYTGEAYHRARYAEMDGLATLERTQRVARVQTSARLQDVTNQAALYDYERQMSVAEMARSSSYITPRTTTEASDLRSVVTSAIDSVLGTTTDDDVYTSYSGLRTAVVRDMTARSRYAADPYTVTTSRPRTSLAVSGRIYGGSDYDEEIASLNRARHPGFLPTVLEVLRRA